MKKTLIVFIVLTSCHLPKYIHSGDINAGLDFNKGRWLLNQIEAPYSIKEELTQTSIKEFRALIGNRFSTISETTGVLVPQNISNNPSKSILKDIKNGSGFDYFIDIKAKKIKDELGSLQIGKVYSRVENMAEVTVAIYDLNLLENIYSQTVRGNLIAQKNNSDFVFAKSADDLIVKGLNKIFRKIRTNKF